MMHQEGRPQDTMLESLRGYDTVIIVDDSQSMSWYGRWAEVCRPQFHMTYECSRLTEGYFRLEQLSWHSQK